MPYYASIKYAIRDKEERRRALEGLKKLRKQLNEEIPSKEAEGRLLLATWNIRDFDKGNRRGYGERLAETHYFIAEIISHFDFVAVQEINSLDEWRKIMSILGRDWDFICTDVTDTKLGGNGERLTYVFDRRKVSFQNIAGEIVLPADMLISRALIEPEDEEGKKIYAGKQFRRSPFLAFFQAGWFKFAICTVHLYYGAESGAKLQERIEEIEAVAKYFGERADKELKDDRTLILLGDFNIVHPEHDTMKALLDNGFVAPKSLKKPSNVLETKYYDQIVFKTEADVVNYIDSAKNSGVFPIFKSIMTGAENDFETYKAAAKKTPNGKKKAAAELRKYYIDWRTYQLSDHNPMWCRIDVDSSAEYLDGLLDELKE